MIAIADLFQRAYSQVKHSIAPYLCLSSEDRNLIDTQVALDLHFALHMTETALMAARNDYARDIATLRANRPTIMAQVTDLKRAGFPEFVSFDSANPTASFPQHFREPSPL